MLQWTVSGVIGPSGQNVVLAVAEEYNSVSAPVVTRSSAVLVVMVTKHKSESAAQCHVKVTVSC